jgi:4-amino-4-deoxy-L-arabinose transferase-like glycosyltransferase
MTTSSSQSIETALPWPAQRGETGQQSSYLPATIMIVVALTIVRLVALRFSVVDLFYDEAQYWSWSRELALGYYTKPPLLAWIISAATHVCGNDEWCVRAPSSLLHGGTSIVVYAIGKRLYDERAGFWAALSIALATGVVFSSRIISTDVPLLFFWALALWAYVNMLVEPSKRWALLLGVAIGLGMLAKYAMIYFLPGMALAALFSRRARLLFKRPEVWLALVVAILVIAPNIAWNASNGFATVEHTGDIVLGDPVHPSIMRALEFLGTQFVVFSPVIFAVMIIATLRLRSSALVEQDRILIAFFIPALAVVTVFAFWVKANGNWAAASAISGAVLTGALLSRRDVKGWMGLSVAIGVVVQVALISTDAIADRLAIPHVANPYRRTMGWRQYAAAVGDLAQKSGAKSIVTDSRADFAALQYYLRGRPEQVLWWRPISVPSFGLKDALTQSSPGPILYPSACASLAGVRETYSKIDPLGPVAAPITKVARDGERVFYGFLLSGPRGPIPPFTGC